MTKATQMTEPKRRLKSEARNIQKGRSPVGFRHSALLRTSTFGFRISPRSAFTLFELLVVIAVLSLLAATLLPALAKSRPTSLAFQCLNNHRQFCAAWRMYADDSNDRIVYASDDGNGSYNPLNQYAWTWPFSASDPNSVWEWNPAVDIYQRPLWPYTGKNLSIYKCPSDNRTIYVNGARKPRLRTMCMNLYLGGRDATYGSWTSSAYRLFLKTTELTAPGPTKTFVFVDGRPDDTIYGDFIVAMDSSTIGDYPNMLHNLGCSFSFADGRAEIHRWSDKRTTPPMGSLLPLNDPSPANQDVAWLQDHTTRPK